MTYLFLVFLACCDEHIFSLLAPVFHFNSEIGDQRAIESGANLDADTFIFRLLHRTIMIPAEAGLCVVVPLKRKVTCAENQCLCPPVATLFGAHLHPALMEHSALPRAPGKRVTSDFCEPLGPPGQAPDPDFYLARAAD